MNHQKLNFGFTLLELLIVISIIGILVAIGVAAYSSAQLKARNSRRMQDIRSIQSAAEQYYADNNSEYPVDTDFGVLYLPTGWPAGPKGDTYTYSTDAAYTTFCSCAALEPASNTFGNATASDCTGFGTPGAFYCAKNLQ